MRTIKRDIVGAFIFSKDNKILLGKAGVYDGAYAVPGGGIENGETEDEAARREMLEETGIDIFNYPIEKCKDASFGSSEKVLRDSGERVLVEMRFIDYIVTINQAADVITVKAEDDFSEPTWFGTKDLRKIELTPPTKRRLISLGFYNE